MLYSFKAIGDDGHILSSTIEATNKPEAVSALSKKNLKVVHICEGMQSCGVRGALFGHRQRVKTRGKVDQEALIHFFEKLHKMVVAGLTLTDAIASIGKRSTTTAEMDFTNGLLASISSGCSLSDALKRTGLKIDDNIHSIIVVGESSGNLASALRDSVDFLAAKRDVARRIVSSLTYPAFMTGMVVVVMVVFMFAIMPRIEGFIKGFGAEPPFMMEFLKKFVGATCFLIPIGAVAAAVGVIVVRNMRKTAGGCRATDGLILRIFPMSVLIPLSTRTNLANLMATLLSNGIPMAEALKMARSSIGNVVIAERFADAEGEIFDGKSVCESFEKYGILDGEACDIVAVGEKVGNLAPSFREIHRIYDGNLKTTIKKVTFTISVIAMTITFTLVGIVAFAMMQAITRISSGIS
jgi:type II secretory pathway component PulF